MQLQDARTHAVSLMEQLRPYCYRIEIAGSIRRNCPEVKDIELVAIRNTRELPRLKVFLDRFPRIKGKVDGKYVQFRYHEVQVDLFFAEEDNWGLIFAIRTGSAQFSHKVLAKGWVRAGYHSRNGYLQDNDGYVLPVREERDLFDLIKIRWYPPVEREL